MEKEDLSIRRKSIKEKARISLNSLKNKKKYHNWDKNGAKSINLSDEWENLLNFYNQQNPWNGGICQNIAIVRSVLLEAVGTGLVYIFRQDVILLLSPYYRQHWKQEKGGQ